MEIVVMSLVNFDNDVMRSHSHQEALQGLLDISCIPLA